MVGNCTEKAGYMSPYFLLCRLEGDCKESGRLTALPKVLSAGTSLGCKALKEVE